ncbi:hypothetical protein [Oxalicibacterium solurbis]|uniref:Uncharacterized protein n=1 Tax=Oxalicibacterium solurbis TaxID=69280 RepID=A0A8J3AX48_9BURK|nr:hypothetical protein [Oxalicibacterium solurbis]GGI55134.1 hypothetical protein GCM10011430_23080 [Oxalicibacterium solurbis]
MRDVFDECIHASAHRRDAAPHICAALQGFVAAYMTKPAKAGLPDIATQRRKFAIFNP